MPSRLSLVLDANLLLLFTVGSTNKKLIKRHKKLKAYSVADYDLLVDLISATRETVVTPNTLTEVSNLLKQGMEEPARTLLYETFRTVIHATNENVVSSKTASDAKEFVRLGLTDAALLEIMTGERSLLTADLDLYLATLKRGGSAINFFHLKQTGQRAE